MAHHFFAVALPEEVKSYLHQSSEELKKSFPYKRWVHPADYHITLAFLGHASFEQLQTVLNNIEQDMDQFSSFPLHIHQLNTFGQRILWAGVKHSEPLHQLQHFIYNQCTSAGFQLDKRPYKPHITLARQWMGKQPLQKEKLLQISMDQVFTVKDIVLYKTHMDRTPKYENIHTFTLQ